MDEPQLRIGVMAQPELVFRFNGIYLLEPGGIPFSDVQKVNFREGKIWLNGKQVDNRMLIFNPVHYSDDSFELTGVTIGVQFHWQRKENQTFKGSLEIRVDNEKLSAINILPLEDYLVSVISSEMKATSSLELLKAHAVISRSWLMAQIIKSQSINKDKKEYRNVSETPGEYIRWYDREDHTLFDVCADDHCQRYQGITRQSTPEVEHAVARTRGMFLWYDGKICDARFSKSCGGISETFENVWEPEAHPYLQPVVDNPVAPNGFDCCLTNEEAAQKWIRNNPDAFCNTHDKQILSQVLNDYDLETTDFYRWKVTYRQTELAELIARKTGRDFGAIIDLVPVERGFSGRLTKLKIVGTKFQLTIGKELEIRKTLSETHLYSSAFVVDRGDMVAGVPQTFIITGAGWGHGVGLCQIGAAVMSSRGYKYDQILKHYFRGASLKKEY